MVGDPTTVARVFNERNADELVFLDILASKNNKEPNFQVVEDIAKECFMPLSIGGGINSLKHADKLFDIGAEKVVLNTSAVKQPDLITKISENYGSQAVMVSIDAKKMRKGYKSFILSGTVETKYTPVALAKLAEQHGAGEILLNSIDMDGTTEGYDINLIRQVADSVSIPVIAAGGCGKLQDFADAIKKGNADAVCAASLFYYIGESIITAKDYLHREGMPVRLI